MSATILKILNTAINLGKASQDIYNTISKRHMNKIQINSKNKNKSEYREYKFKLPDKVCNKIGNNENQWILKHVINENKNYGYK